MRRKRQPPSFTAQSFEVMNGATGERILEVLDFCYLKNDLFHILQVIMTKKEFVFNDRAIIDLVANSAIIFNNKELIHVILDQWNTCYHRVRWQDLISDHLQCLRESRNEL